MMMERSGTHIRLGDLDDLIERGFGFLRFPRDVEYAFEEEGNEARCRKMIWLNLFGMAAYHLFLVSDYHAVNDVFQTDLVMHFLVMTPVLIILNVLLARRPAAWFRETIEAFALIVMSLTIVLVLWNSKSNVRDIVQLTVILVVLFATAMQRLRFWYSVVVCLAAQFLYSCGLANLTPFSMDRFLMANIVFSGIFAFSLFGAYHLEYEARVGFLLRLRDRLRNLELEAISLRDQLTGVANRRAMERTFSRLAEGVPGEQTAVLLLDVDHFKQFNDLNGHLAGDACLIQVAKLMSDLLWEGEGTVYRFGGEEFLVILENSNTIHASFVAERICAASAHADIQTAPGTTSIVTVSIGVALGCLTAGETSGALIAKADRALYQAKRNGRNQVILGGARDAESEAPFIEHRMAS